tara:strand:+ start:11492 stop:11743 length:252 start_codon:yes stop_codon:yes gene_type:complete
MSVALYIISNIIVSILIIYVFHLLWDFIINKFSTKKKKDMVNKQISKYNDLVEELKKSTKDQEFTKEVKENLENELTEFMDTA